MDLMRYLNYLVLSQRQSMILIPFVLISCTIMWVFSFLLLLKLLLFINISSTTENVCLQDKAAVISVAGVFREHPTLQPDPDHMRSFRRVFNLCCTAPNEWQIINELLHISNLTTEQADVRMGINQKPFYKLLISNFSLLTELNFFSCFSPRLKLNVRQ